MNERIAELAKQCNFTPQDIEDMNPGFEKFANLVIQECADFIAPLGDYCGGHGEPREPSTRDCAEKLKQHFGVK